HHALLRGIAFSVERFPVGGGWVLGSAAEPMVRQGAGLFTLGFALASPVVLGLLLLDFVLAVVSRNLPQMNIFMVGLPLKITLGLLSLSVWAAGFGAPARRLYQAIYQAWNAWFAGGPR
ncbi:MAG: flagellar biosynthetic protein FliR, partial [Burkholderiales bacterium]